MKTRKPTDVTHVRRQLREALAMLRRASDTATTNDPDGNSPVTYDYAIGYAKSAITWSLKDLGEDPATLCLNCSLQASGQHHPWCRTLDGQKPPKNGQQEVQP